MKQKERIQIIREGNELFNQGKIREASELFKTVKYIDGLIRVGDYYYDKRQPLLAVGYYKMANRKEKVDEIRERMVFALRKLLSPEYNSLNKTAANKTNTNENSLNETKAPAEKNNPDNIGDK